MSGDRRATGGRGSQGALSSTGSSPDGSVVSTVTSTPAAPSRVADLMNVGFNAAHQGQGARGNHGDSKRACGRWESFGHLPCWWWMSEISRQSSQYGSRSPDDGPSGSERVSGGVMKPYPLSIHSRSECGR